MTTFLLVGRTHEVLQDAAERVGLQRDAYAIAITVAEVESRLRESSVAHVVMGGGISVEMRVSVFEKVLRTSEATTVHAKDHASGPEGYEPFLRALVGAFGAPMTVAR